MGRLWGGLEVASEVESVCWVGIGLRDDPGDGFCVQRFALRAIELRHVGRDDEKGWAGRGLCLRCGDMGLKGGRDVQARDRAE